MLLHNSGKSQRESFGEIPYSKSSQNFIVKWGEDPMVQIDQIDNLLLFLEDSWFKYVNEMSHVPPPSSYTYYLQMFSHSLTWPPRRTCA